MFKELKLEKPYGLQEIIQYAIDNPEKIDEYCLYANEDNLTPFDDMVYYISDYPEVNDNDEEVFSKFVESNNLDLFISGQQLVDVIVNTQHQKDDKAKMDDFLINIDYYLNNDTFFDF